MEVEHFFRTSSFASENTKTFRNALKAIIWFSFDKSKEDLAN